MATQTLAHIKPEVLRWARESAGYSVQDAAAKIGVRWFRLEAAEEGADLLTLRQAEAAAKTYERPLAALFLPEPPAEDPQETQFRRLPGAPAPPWPPEMQLLARRIRERQDAALQLYEVLDESPPWPGQADRFRVANPFGLSRIAREVLGVGGEEQRSWADGYAALRGWTDAVEALGVLVMQDGSMPVERLRGFASMHPTVPAIVVNSKDDERSRAFTVVHELGHLLLAANGIDVGPETEAWCDDFAGEVIMPTDWLQVAFKHALAPDLILRVERVAREFRVTPLAAAVRLARTKTVPQRDIDPVIEEIRERGGEGDGEGGGDYYLNQIAWLGPGYIRLVLEALDRQAVTYPSASALLGGVKVNNLETLRERLDRRTALG